MTKISFLTILGMGIATYITRASGIFIASRFKMTPRFKAALSGIPVAIIISIIVPDIINGGLAEYLSCAVVILLAVKRVNIIFCLAAGIIAINLFRYLI